MEKDEKLNKCTTKGDDSKRITEKQKNSVSRVSARSFYHPRYSHIQAIRVPKTEQGQGYVFQSKRQMTEGTRHGACNQVKDLIMTLKPNTHDQ